MLTTHQLEVAHELSDRIAVIKKGEIIADLPTPELLSRHAENRFEVRVTGSSEGLADALPNGARIQPEGEETRVTLPDTDGHAVYVILDRLRAQDRPLVSVTQARPSLEEVFIRLINTGGTPVTKAVTPAKDVKEPVE